MNKQERIKEGVAEINEIFEEFLKDAKSLGFGFIINRNTLTGITTISAVSERQGDDEPPFFVISDTSAIRCAQKAMQRHTDELAGITPDMRNAVNTIDKTKH